MVIRVLGLFPWIHRCAWERSIEVFPFQVLWFSMSSLFLGVQLSVILSYSNKFHPLSWRLRITFTPCIPNVKQWQACRRVVRCSFKFQLACSAAGDASWISFGNRYYVVSVLRRTCWLHHAQLMRSLTQDGRWVTDYRFLEIPIFLRTLWLE